MLLVPPVNSCSRYRHSSNRAPRLCRKLRVSVHASRGGGQGSSRRRDVDDEVGWWEKPDPFEEKNPLDSLSPWQTRRLEQAYAAGRRKVQVSALAKEIDVDRSIVTEWFKRFSKLPESEQNAIVAERQRELEWEATKAQARAAAAAERPQREPLGPKPEEPEPSGSGFIPFQIRKSMPKEKKIRQDVLRTLEMVYERSSYPSDDVIRSLWDLHKIPRSMAIDWFSSKRKAAAQASTSEPSTSEASDSRPQRATSKQKAEQPEKLEKPDRKGAKGAKQREARDTAAAAAAGAAAAAAAATSGSRTAAAGATPSVPSASSDTTDAATPGPEASGDAKREVKRKKGRFDDVKIVVADDVGPASESQVQGPPQQEGQSMENLVMAYGELLVKVAKKEDISDLVGPDRPETWAQAWRWHQHKKALLAGPTRLNWAVWLDRLQATRPDEVDDELRALDLY